MADQTKIISDGLVENMMEMTREQLETIIKEPEGAEIIYEEITKEAMFVAMAKLTLEWRRATKKTIIAKVEKDVIEKVAKNNESKHMTKIRALNVKLAKRTLENISLKHETLSMRDRLPTRVIKSDPYFKIHKAVNDCQCSCGEVMLKKNLPAHIERKNKFKTIPCEVEGCKFTTKDETGLMLHMKNKHKLIRQGQEKTVGKKVFKRGTTQ